MPPRHRQRWRRRRRARLSGHLPHRPRRQGGALDPPARAASRRRRGAAPRSPGTTAGSASRRQDVAGAVGDFVLKRADGVFAYQLAVVVDDAELGVTDVVRGEDLADSTARQILLQRLLGLATPRYLHTPLVRTGDGVKLSKQTGAAPLSPAAPLAALRDAGTVLDLPARGATIAEWLVSAVAAWRVRYAAG